MNIKTILYIIVVPITIWALESLNINQFFKKNRYYQARFIYLILKHTSITNNSRMSALPSRHPVGVILCTTLTCFPFIKIAS